MKGAEIFVETLEAKKQENENFSLEYISFYIGKELFAVKIDDIREIVKITGITRVPNSPTFIKGVINLRGKILPVMDLRTKLKMGEIEYGKDTRIIISEHSNVALGLIVDSVSEVLRINPDHIAEPPDNRDDSDSRYVEAVANMGNKIVTILNVDTLLEK